MPLRSPLIDGVPRNRRVADAVLAGDHPTVAAERYGVSYIAAWKACKKFGVDWTHLHKDRRKVDYESRWRQIPKCRVEYVRKALLNPNGRCDRRIAKEFGVPRWVVAEVREEMKRGV